MLCVRVCRRAGPNEGLLKCPSRGATQSAVGACWRPPSAGASESFPLERCCTQAQMSAKRRPLRLCVWLIWPLHAQAQPITSLLRKGPPWVLRRLCTMQIAAMKGCIRSVVRKISVLYLSPLKIGCDCTEATGRTLCRRVSVSSGSCNVKGSCWVGQRGDKINALAARRASLSGAQQSLKRSLAALPGQPSVSAGGAGWSCKPAQARAHWA